LKNPEPEPTGLLFQPRSELPSALYVDAFAMRSTPEGELDIFVDP